MGRRKVVYARTLSNIFVPGAADLGTVLPPPSKTLADLVMTKNDLDNLEVSFKYGGRNFEILVKDVTFMSLAPEPKVEPRVVGKPAVKGTI